MKKYLFIFALLLGTISSWGQTAADFVFIDQSAPNLTQLQTQYTGQPNVFVNDNPKPAAYMVAAMVEGRQVADLHIYVGTSAGSLNFRSGSISETTAVNYAQFFERWKNLIKGQVVIHSSEVFTNSQGIALKTKLEQLTGLNFISQ